MHKSQISRNSLGVVSALIIAASITLAMLFMGGIAAGVYFALFQILCILIPGMAIVTVLKLKLNTNMEWLILAYYFGYCLNMLEYLFIVPFHMQQYANILNAVVFALSIYILFISTKKETCLFIISKDKRGAIICSTFFCIIYVLLLFTYVGVNLVPPQVDKNYLFGDLSYWIGNIIELKQSFPPHDFRNYMQSYNYHYLSSLQLAYVSISTGIRPYVLGLSFSCIQSTFLMVGGAYLLFSKVSHKLWVILLSMWFLFFASGREDFSIVTYSSHLYRASFGFDYGLGIFLILLYFIICSYREEKYNSKYSILIIFSIIIATGTKAPFGAIGLSGIGILSIYWLIKKQYKNAFITGLLSLLVFLITYFCVTNVNGYGGSEYYEYIAMPSSIYDTTTYLGSVFIRFKESMSRLSAPIILLLFDVIYCFRTNPVIFLMVALICIGKLFAWKKIKIIDITLLVMILLGLYIGIHIYMFGFSNMYFTMTAFPLGILFFAMNEEQLPVRKISIPIILLAGVCSSYLMSLGCNNYSLFQAIQKGYNNYQGISQYEETKMININSKLMSGYDYIRNNIKENIFATNSTDAAVGVFTEKYVVTESNNEFVKALTENKRQNIQKEAVKHLKDEGIFYFLLQKNIDSEPEELENIGQIIFENEEMKLFKLD